MWEDHGSSFLTASSGGDRCGSRSDSVGWVGLGAIYQVNLATGEGSFFVEAQERSKALGIVYDQATRPALCGRSRSSGNGMVFNGLTGELVANVQFTTDPNGLVNDVALADDVVYFTRFRSTPRLPVASRLRATEPDPSTSRDYLVDWRI